MSTRNAPPEAPHYLSIPELAARYDVPVKTVRHWRETGKGPAGIKIGRHVRYSLEAVTAWEASKAEASP